MKGVTIQSDAKNGVTLCLVGSLSDELKQDLRKKLISICEGEYHSKIYSDFFTYKSTLVTFLERYQSKPDKTQMGMIGELLCHLLLPREHKNLKIMSPFFNMEEGAIKKGHDLIYFDDSDEVNTWIVEVKSGELGKATSVGAKKKSLLSTANKDLKIKLTSRKTNLWRNALKGMDSTLENGVTKKVLAGLLRDYRDKTISGTQSSDEYNVVLATSLFHPMNEKVTLVDLQEWKIDNLNGDEYKDVLIFSIQKCTYQAVVEFLQQELKSIKDIAS